MKAMESNMDDWTRVGNAIAARMDEVPLIKAEVIRASKISGKTLDGYLEGKPVVRGDKKRELCAALGWTADSIDRIRRGEDPVVIPGWTKPTTNGSPSNDTSDTSDITDRLHRLIDELARRARW